MQIITTIASPFIEDMIINCYFKCVIKWRKKKLKLYENSEWNKSDAIATYKYG